MNRTARISTVATAALALGMLGATTLPATADTQAPSARHKVKFGSALDPSIQPSNSLPGLVCDEFAPSSRCTYTMNEAYGRPDGGEKSPVRGTLRKVRVISGGSGQFQLQLTKARNVGGQWQVRVKADGPVLTLEGQDQTNWDSDVYKVETFRVNMPIRKGWRLSMKATGTSAIRCSSGGDNTLINKPALSPGGSFTNTSDEDGCWPLIEGVVRF